MENHLGVDVSAWQSENKQVVEAQELNRTPGGAMRDDDAEAP